MTYTHTEATLTTIVMENGDVFDVKLVGEDDLKIYYYKGDVKARGVIELKLSAFGYCYDDAVKFSQILDRLFELTKERFELDLSHGKTFKKREIPLVDMRDLV